MRDRAAGDLRHTGLRTVRQMEGAQGFGEHGGAMDGPERGDWCCCRSAQGSLGHPRPPAITTQLGFDSEISHLWSPRRFSCAAPAAHQVVEHSTDWVNDYLPAGSGSSIGIHARLESRRHIYDHFIIWPEGCNVDNVPCINDSIKE
jgi:hypothetical protein